MFTIILQFTYGDSMLNLMIKGFAQNNKYNDDFCFKQLQELELETDWDVLVETIYPHYVKSKIKPLSLTIESMLRIYILAHHFDMSPSRVKKALYQIDAFKEFALIDLDRDEIPDASRIAHFNSLLIEKSLARKVEKALRLKLKKAQYSAAF